MPKSKLSKDFIDKWSHLLSEIDMDDVPIEYIERMELYFNNGDNPAFIDVTRLLESNKPHRIEKILSKELEDIDDILDRVDFHLDLEKVVKVVGEATDDALKKIS